MTKVWIVEEFTWDHHDNVGVFSSEELAIAFCDKTYKKNKRCSRNQYCSDESETPLFDYNIDEYDIDSL